MKILLSLFFTFCTVCNCYSQNDKSIIPFNLISQEDCQDKKVSTTLLLYNTSDSTIEISNIHSDLKEFKIFNEQKILNRDENLIIKQYSEISLNVEFIFTSKQNQEIEFSSNEKIENPNYKVSMISGAYSISSEDVEKGEEITLHISESCSDSVRIYFPYGGTISSVSFYDNETNMSSKRDLSYDCGNDSNYVTLPKDHCRKYFIRFFACHWSSKFWLNLE